MSGGRGLPEAFASPQSPVSCLDDVLVVVRRQAMTFDVVRGLGLVNHGLVVVARESMCLDIVLVGCGLVAFVDRLVVVRREAMSFDVLRLVIDDGLIVIRREAMSFDVVFVDHDLGLDRAVGHRASLRCKESPGKGCHQDRRARGRNCSKFAQGSSRARLRRAAITVGWSLVTTPSRRPIARSQAARASSIRPLRRSTVPRLTRVVASAGASGPWVRSLIWSARR